MNNEPLQVRYGIIGCGMMGQEHLRNIALLPGARVTRIFEPDEAMAASSLALAQGAVRATSLAEVVSSADVDCLLIASPNFCHADQLREIASIRPLPVLLEKPACTRLSDVRDLAALSASYPAPIWVAMEYRYMPPVTRLTEEVRSGAHIGALTMLSIREHRFPFLVKVGDWNRFNRYTGGTLVEKCCHFFDLMCVLAKSAPVSVMASGSQDVNHLAENYGGRTPDILDNAYVIVNFENGVRGMLDLCMFAEASKNEQEICVVGDKGKIEALISESVVRIGKRKNGYGTFQDFPIELEKDVVQGFHHGASFVEHRQMQEAMRNGRKADIGLSEGLISVAIGQAAHMSIDQGRLVLISEVLA